MHHFNTIEFVNVAKKNGITEEFAEYTARQIEHLSDTIQEQKLELSALTFKEIATKGDVRESELRLQKEIEAVSHSTFKSIIYTGVVVCIYLTGAAYTMFKLLIHP